METKDRIQYPIPRHIEAHAHITPSGYKTLYEQSLMDRDAFWRDQASFIDWIIPFTRVDESRFDPANPQIRWFSDGVLNASVNCLDRHLPQKAEQVAIHWEGDDPSERRTVTWQQLSEQVNRLANVLLSLGVKKGDVVTIYLPVIPEIMVAMLACTRIGAIHSVVFSGFSADALADRIQDAKAKILITANEGHRGGQIVPLKENADTAIENIDHINHVIVVRRAERETPWQSKRDIWFHEAIEHVSDWAEPVALNAEDPLFILYTSGSTGKPKGLVHSIGGYLVHAGTSWRNIFDWHEGDVFWCTADVGWVTAHTYKIYGPLLNGATSVLFEGTPTWPDASRWWSIIERYGVTTFYTAPTAIRALMRQGVGPVQKYDLSSLRILGSVGEPINPEAWKWFHDVIGGGNCPIVDTYWQTETGAVLLVPFPGATPNKPGYAAKPYFGIQPVLMNAQAQEIIGAGEGSLCFDQSWPGQARTILNNHDRFAKTYFQPFPGYFFSGDGARRDEEGYYRISGRIDDVINVSGHRLGTVELESTIASHPAVAEAAVVGFPHDIKGQGIFAYVTLKLGFEENEALHQELIQWVRKKIGPIATVDQLLWTPELPKNRAGKILRRILNKVAVNQFDDLGDISTLANPDAVQEILHRRQTQLAPS